MTQQAHIVYEFDSFKVDPVERLLLTGGSPVYLTPKAFDVLLILIRNSGRLIEKSEFMRLAWSDSFVEESNLTVIISLLRKTLNGAAPEQNYIQTVAKRGYRFVGNVKEIREFSKIRSLAVLPFRCLTPEDAHEYLRLGLVDAIITRLASTGRLVVRPTAAILRYQENVTDPIVVGREQKVDAILTGHFEIFEERVRVSVQLVRVEDAALLWAKSYDKDIHEIFALEDAVAEAVAQSTIATSPWSDSQQALPRRNSENSKAYRLYLEGRYFWNQRTTEGLRKGIECFRRAIKEDPEYALAFSGLADSYVLLASHGVQSALDALPIAKEAAQTALKLDASLAEARTSLGMVHFYYEWDWEKARQEFQQAIFLNPNYIVARMWYASNLATLGKFNEALLQVRHAEDLDPLSLGVHIKAGRLHYWSRDYTQAISSFRKVLGLNPLHARAHTRLGMTYAAKQAYQEALDEFKTAQQIAGADPYLDGLIGYVQARSGRRSTAAKILKDLKTRALNAYVPAFSAALIHIGLNDDQSALTWLEKAYDDRSAYMVFAKVEPLLDPMRSHPRFTELLARMNLQSM